MVGRFARLRQKHTRNSDQSESNARKSSDTTISAERVSADVAFEKESASSGESGTFDQRCCRPRGIFQQQLFLPSVQASLRSSSAEVSENAAVRRRGSYSSLYLDRSGSWNSPNSVTEVLSQLIPLRMSFAGVPAISEFSS